MFIFQDRILKRKETYYVSSKYFISMWIRNSNIIYGSCKTERKTWRKRIQCYYNRGSSQALNLATSGRFDILTHTSPLPDGDYTIPTVNAFACITGMGEDQFFEEVIAALKSVGK